MSNKALSLAAAILGSAKSARKTAACRRNAKRPRPNRRKKGTLKLEGVEIYDEQTYRLIDEQIKRKKKL